MAVTSAPIGLRSRRRSVGWIHSRPTDVALALAWLPFVLVAMVLPDGALRWYAAGVLLLSLAHQPITVALVYADGEQVAARRRLVVMAPLALAALVFVGLQISFLLVAVIGGLWNTEHTLMQRYGLTRIYRRKGGDRGDGRLDLLVLSSWLVLVLAWAVADTRTPARIEQLGLGTANERSLQLLVDARPYATVLLGLAVAVATLGTARWLHREWVRGFDANPAVYLYVGATAALFATAMVHPIAGLLAWVGAHAIEYFIVVATSLGSRRHKSSDATLIGRTLRGRLGVAGFIGLSSAVGVVAVLLAQFHASLVVYGMVFFCVGGLHILYDGVIWKLRRPPVAESFSLDPG